MLMCQMHFTIQHIINLGNILIIFIYLLFSTGFFIMSILACTLSQNENFFLSFFVTVLFVTEALFFYPNQDSATARLNPVFMLML